MARKEVPPPDLLTDEEIRQRMMADPEIRVRVERALARAKRPPTDPGISAEELPEFLREHGF